MKPERVGSLISYAIFGAGFFGLLHTSFLIYSAALTVGGFVLAWRNDHVQAGPSSTLSRGTF